MTPGVRVHVVMPSDLVERIDLARGEGQSRGDWVRRAVEAALDQASDPDPGSRAQSSVRQAASVPAPAEQPGRVSPLRVVSPRVPSVRPYVAPFQRGDK